MLNALHMHANSRANPILMQALPWWECLMLPNLSWVMELLLTPPVRGKGPANSKAFSGIMILMRVYIASNTSEGILVVPLVVSQL